MREKKPISFEDVIEINNYLEALTKCKKGVGFKLSVQLYDAHAIHIIAETVERLRNGEVPYLKDVQKIILYERGKRRVITPIRIEDRMTQKVICDNALLPSVENRLIYDNGASRKNMGVDLARARLMHHILEEVRTYGPDSVYVLKFDFKGYFDNIPHEQCFRVLDECIQDKRLREIIVWIILSYKIPEISSLPEEKQEEEFEKLFDLQYKGICLGSQISQILALLVPNKFDHYIKDYLRIKHYIRYMDDGIIIHHDKKYLADICGILEKEAASYGLTFNPKKTVIVKMTKGFTFLKIHYRLAQNGKVIRTLSHSSVVRMRRKLKKFKAKVDTGQMTVEDVYNSVQSWISHAKYAKQSYHSVKSILLLYDELFGGYRITKKYFHDHPEVKRKRKVFR